MLPFSSPCEAAAVSGAVHPFEDFPLFPALPQLETQRLMQAVCAQNSWLMAEVKALKQTLQTFTAEVSQKLDHLAETAAYTQINSFERPKKKFRKVIECPFAHCGHRYSSKIALNCHIRIKHQIKVE